MTVLRVLSSGVRTTVQDLGRPGFARAGVPTAGALDRLSLMAANRAVGNPEDAAGLECVLSLVLSDLPGGRAVPRAGPGPRRGHRCPRRPHPGRTGRLPGRHRISHPGTRTPRGPAMNPDPDDLDDRPDPTPTSTRVDVVDGVDLGGEVIEVSAATFRQALDRTKRHDYKRFAAQVDTTGGCSHPVRLVGPHHQGRHRPPVRSPRTTSPPPSPTG